MKRLFFNLIASALLLGLGWLVPHSVFDISIESGASTPATVLPAEPTSEPSSDPLPATTITTTPEPDAFSELYFTLVGFNQSPRLVRLPGACVVGLEPCPEPETIPTPFDMTDVFTNRPQGLVWSPDGQFGVLITHPEDDLSRGRTAEELAQLKTQSPADFDVSPSMIYLFGAGTDTWQEVYRAERKFIGQPVWSADGQWLAFTMRSSVWALHPMSADDGVYVIHPDGSGLQQLSNIDAEILGWIGSSIAVRQNTQPYPAIHYEIGMLALDGQLKLLFESDRAAFYNLAPDSGVLLVSDAQNEQYTLPQKRVDILALDGSVIHSVGAFDNQTASIWSTAWSSDGSQIAFANLRRVYVASRAGILQEIYSADDTFVEPAVWNMQFSPDQRFLLLDVYDGTPKFVTVSLESGQATTLTWPNAVEDEQPTDFSWRP